MRGRCDEHGNENDVMPELERCVVTPRKCCRFTVRSGARSRRHHITSTTTGLDGPLLPELVNCARASDMGTTASTVHHPELAEEDPSAQSARGLLLEETQAGWNQVYGVLKRRSLAFFSSEEDYLQGREPRSQLSLANCGVRSLGTTIEITSLLGDGDGRPRRFAVQVFDHDEAPAWLRALRIASREPWRDHSKHAGHCFLCDVAFDAWSRPHHCRRCGELCCGMCAAKFIALPDYGYDRARVCVGCYTEAQSGGPVISAVEREARKARAEQEAEALRARLAEAEAVRRRENVAAGHQLRRDRLKKMYGTEAVKAEVAEREARLSSLDGAGEAACA